MGRPLRSVAFDGSDLTAARAELNRFALEVGVCPHPSVPPNRAAFLNGVWLGLALESRTDDMRAMMRADFRAEDRRPLARVQFLDREALIDTSRLIGERGMRISRDVIATDGDHRALFRQWVTDGDFDDEMLILGEFDEQDLAVRSVQFAPDAADVAIAELHRVRSVGGTGVPRNRAVEVNEVNLALGAARRWDQLKATAHPDFVMEDRRKTPREPVMDAGRVLDAAPVGADFAPQLVRSEVLATRGELHALMHETFVVGDFEDEWLSLLQIDEASRSVRYIQFDSDDLDIAMAELERLAAGRVHPIVAAMRHGAVCAAAGNWDGYADTMTADCRYIDRGRQAGALELGRDGLIASVRTAVDELGLTQEIDGLVAARGHRLALVRTREALPTGFGSDHLVIVRSGEHGRFDLILRFDDCDLNNAVDELERLVP